MPNLVILCTKCNSLYGNCHNITEILLKVVLNTINLYGTQILNVYIVKFYVCNMNTVVIHSTINFIYIFSNC